MSKKILFYKIASLFAVSIWSGMGLLTLGSILNGTIGLVINITMGIVFMLIALYLYARTKIIVDMLTYPGFSIKENQSATKILSKFLFFEKILVFTGIFIGSMFLWAAMTRVFGEGFPLFG